MKRNTFLKLSGLTAASIGLPSCGEKDDRVKLAFVTNATADFWLYAKAGVAAAEKELGDVNVTFKVGDSTPAKQREIIDALIVSGVKGVSLSPTTPDAQGDMIAEWSKKAKVMCVDSDAPGTDRALYLGTDNVAAGRECGKLVKEALPNGGRLMAFVGIASQLNSKERYQGLKEELEGSGIEVLDLKTDEGSEAVAREKAQDVLTRESDLDCMVGLWSYNAPQILSAVKDAKRLDKVKIIGFDEDERTLRAIDAGEMQGTICQEPYLFGNESVKILHQLVVQGKEPKDVKLSGDLKMVDGQIFVPTKTIRKAEALDYLAQCNKWKEELK